MKTKLFILILASFFLIPSLSFGADNVGAVVALKGSAVIQREAKAMEAKLKDSIQLVDVVETKDQTRTKMLFIDDSVLTMGERSKVSIREFVYSKDREGKAVFNLIDGKMRAVVGRTGFEVHTRTLVAAARGTVIDFETGILDGKYFTTVTCLEGEVDIRSIDPTITGKIVLSRGMTVTVVAGQSLPAPKPALSTTATAVIAAEAASPAKIPLNAAPPLSQQPAAVNTTPLTIGVKIP